MESPDVTLAIQRLTDGLTSAADELLPLVYDELRRIASRMMEAQPAGHTLQPTALVNEACMRLLGAAEPSWQNRAHFFAVAATAMRQILTSHARAKLAAKRGSGQVKLLTDEPLDEHQEPGIDLIALDDALTRLSALNPRQSRLVELRFYSGMTLDEAALVLDISPATADREWRMVRAWLKAELRDDAHA